MSSLLINKIILGTVQLGLEYGINNTKGKPSVEEALEILQTAYSNGIRMLDTAEAYGTSHEILGTYHRQNGNRTFAVITKSTAQPTGNSKNHFKENLLRAFDELQIERLEGYLFHNFDQYLKFEHWDVLETFQARDKISKIGVSVYTNEQIEIAEKDEKLGLFQLPFNLLDNNFHRGKVLSSLKKRGKEIHTRSVFFQGLFFKKRNELGKLSSFQESLYQLDALADKAGTDIGTLALGYALYQSCIDKVLIGLETEMQLRQNLEMLTALEKIPGEIYNAIDKLEVTNARLLNPTNW